MKLHSLYSLGAILIMCGLFLSCNQSQSDKKTLNPQAREVWSAEKANEWYQQWGWLRGSDFLPSSAINQLEMWQEESFDTETIDRELGLAQSIGFNSMRVYLHHLAWQVDTAGFKDRMNQYLEISDRHGISTLFVFFDDCWNPTYQAGEQPEPKPGIHNSGWVQDPGDSIDINPDMITTLEIYMKDILTFFSNDKRIVLWDLYNEPGNNSLPLVEKAFQWAREVNPSQPLSVGVWNWNLKELSNYQIKNSDVITYHNYGDSIEHKKHIDTLRSLTQRPLICTEYMARTHNSTFQNIMPILKRENIGAYNWGLVDGKSNTKYAWDTPVPDGSEPELWFHDIFHKNGTPYKQVEVDFIKSLTGK